MRDAVAGHTSLLPDLNDVMAALWVRSISIGNQPGAICGMQVGFRATAYGDFGAGT